MNAISEFSELSEQSDLNQKLKICENEALHLSGLIQPHGALLVANQEGIVTHASQNIEQVLGLEVEAWLGLPLPTVLADLIFTRAMVAGDHRYFTGLTVTPDHQADLCVVRGVGSSYLFEIYPTGHEPINTAEVVHLDSLQARGNIDKLKQDLVREIRDITGFGRVMYYEFTDEGDGLVAAEIRNDDIEESYLDLRYPASDIPLIARKLFKVNTWRYIPNAAAQSVPIASEQGTPPDLTLSDIRSVSEMHQIYLHNMGVVASLSFPVIHKDGLVALVAAHDYQPGTLSLSRLNAASRVVKAYNRKISDWYNWQEMQKFDLQTRAERELRKLIELVEHNQDAEGALTELLAKIEEFIPFDYGYLQVGDKVVTAGAKGTARLGRQLIEHIPDSNRASWFTDSITRCYPEFEAGDACGFALISSRNPQLGHNHLVLMRGEYLHEVAWGGDMTQRAVTLPKPPYIMPRSSFHKWVEKKTGYAKPWTSSDKLLLLTVRNLLWLL